MQAIKQPQTLARRAAAVKTVCLALVLGAWSLPNDAAQSSSSFTVAVILRPAAAGPDAGLCRSNTGIGAFGATVTVVCATGAVAGIEATGTGMPWRPIHGGAYRFLTHVASAELSGTIDSYSGAGTSTAFRVVSLAGREYVEMTVGW
jgi:hypothetical protein